MPDIGRLPAPNSTEVVPERQAAHTTVVSRSGDNICLVYWRENVRRTPAAARAARGTAFISPPESRLPALSAHETVPSLPGYTDTRTWLSVGTGVV